MMLYLLYFDGTYIWEKQVKYATKIPYLQAENTIISIFVISVRTIITWNTYK